MINVKTLDTCELFFHCLIIIFFEKGIFFLFQKFGRKSDTQTVAETLYKNKQSLEAIFKILDKDNSGNISQNLILLYLA